jgi:hypothetical protein
MKVYYKQSILPHVLVTHVAILREARYNAWMH